MNDLEIILDDLENKKKAYELEGVELVEEDAIQVRNYIKKGYEYEDALCTVLSDIRQILDDGLLDSEDEYEL